VRFFRGFWTGWSFLAARRFCQHRRPIPDANVRRCHPANAALWPCQHRSILASAWKCSAYQPGRAIINGRADHPANGPRHAAGNWNGQPTTESNGDASSNRHANAPAPQCAESASGALNTSVINQYSIFFTAALSWLLCISMTKESG
jgi:hypothetical protein